MLTPLSSTAAPGGVLVIWSLSALARDGQASRTKAKQRLSSEAEALTKPRPMDEPANYVTTEINSLGKNLRLKDSGGG